MAAQASDISSTDRTSLGAAQATPAPPANVVRHARLTDIVALPAQGAEGLLLRTAREAARLVTIAHASDDASRLVDAILPTRVDAPVAPRTPGVINAAATDAFARAPGTGNDG